MYNLPFRINKNRIIFFYQGKKFQQTLRIGLRMFNNGKKKGKYRQLK